MADKERSGIVRGLNKGHVSYLSYVSFVMPDIVLTSILGYE